MLERFYTGVVKYRKVIFVLFLLAAVTGALLRPLVGVNYDVKDYLPEDTPSTRSLHVMQEEYGGSMPNARVMLRDVTYKEALAYKEELEAVDGVEEVTWLDDSGILISKPLSFADQEELDTYYRMNEDGKTGTALLSISIEKSKRLEAVDEIRRIIGDENCMGGDAVSIAVATSSSMTEIAKTAAVSVLMVLLILILTTRSWLEPMIILAGIGVAVLINNGSNLIFGEISFVTNASGSILQMAVSLDYSVFLIHRFEECRGKGLPLEKAMVEALMKSGGSITSSGLTTIIGFLALMLMRFQIGPDMGMVLAKGVAISLITVFTFTPSMILLLSRVTDKTRHRNFIPDFSKFGRFVLRVTIPAVIVFVLVIAPAFILANHNSYYYGASHIFGPGTQVGDDKEAIEEIFGVTDTYAIMVPKGDHVKEKELTDKLREYPQVKAIRSYDETLSAVIPSHILPESISGLLVSEHYDRIVLTVEAEYEGEETFQLVRDLRKTCESVYGSDYHLVGEGISTYDLMVTVTSDLLKINLAAVLAVFLVLVALFRRFLLPLLLVASIETAIWINVAIPCLLGQNVFYLAYLIISVLQLGATVDYAILMTTRYQENRLRLPKREAMVETIRNVTASICTTGTTLTIVGFLIGALSSHGILAQLGIFIGRGAICSLLIVFLVLPGLLYIFDRFCVTEHAVQEEAHHG